MEINVVSGDITKHDAGAVIVNLFEGVTSPGGGTGAVDAALDGAISGLIASGDITGKSGEHVLVYTLGRLPSPRVYSRSMGRNSGEGTVGPVRGANGSITTQASSPAWRSRIARARSVSL